MMNPIGSQDAMSQGAGQKLTQAQDQKLTVVLSNYDAKNLTDDDAKSLVAQIKEIGIKSGSGLANALNDAGIDAKALGKQASVGGPTAGGPPPGAPPPGGPGGSGGPPPSEGKGRDSVDDSIVSLIAQAVESYQSSDTTETLWSVLEPALLDAGYDTTKINHRLLFIANLLSKTAVNPRSTIRKRPMQLHGPFLLAHSEWGRLRQDARKFPVESYFFGGRGASRIALIAVSI